jgi:uncharacterized protein YchJ
MILIYCEDAYRHKAVMQILAAQYEVANEKCDEYEQTDKMSPNVPSLVVTSKYCPYAFAERHAIPISWERHSKASNYERNVTPISPHIMYGLTVHLGAADAGNPLHFVYPRWPEEYEKAISRHKSRAHSTCCSDAPHSGS